MSLMRYLCIIMMYKSAFNYYGSFCNKARAGSKLGYTTFADGHLWIKERDQTDLEHVDHERNGRLHKLFVGLPVSRDEVAAPRVHAEPMVPLIAAAPLVLALVRLVVALVEVWAFGPVTVKLKWEPVGRSEKGVERSDYPPKFGLIFSLEFIIN